MASILHSNNYLLSKAPLYHCVAFGMAVLGINDELSLAFYKLQTLFAPSFLILLPPEAPVIILISAVCHYIHG